jgi:hypothetical protein
MAFRKADSSLAAILSNNQPTDHYLNSEDEKLGQIMNWKLRGDESNIRTPGFYSRI